jgi:hypothetical protein
VKDFTWWFKVFQCLSEARSVCGITKAVLPHDRAHDLDYGRSMV